MNKLNLIEWDILNRVYCSLYQRQDNYRVLNTNNNGVFERITITNENGDQVFSINRHLNIETHDIKPVEEIARCFTENGIHAT